MTAPYYDHGGITIYHGDNRDVMPALEAEAVDLVLTDPPYPDAYQEAYAYRPDNLAPLEAFGGRQLIFWSARADFPLTSTAVHIWDKAVGVGGLQYERVFERNGGRAQRVYRFLLIGSRVQAIICRDEFNDHPSQKPIQLMRALVRDGGGERAILDPFMGSGSTLRAAKDLGRRAIGIEINERYCEIAARRMSQQVLPLGSAAAK